MMTPSEICLRAAEILAAHDYAWCQGNYRRILSCGRYAYCMIGACREAAGYYASSDLSDTARAGIAALDAAALAVAAAAQDTFHVPSAGAWNDAACRTREEVIAALRAC